MFADAYDRDEGRPSYPPSRVFRICWLQFRFNLSDAVVCEAVAWNLLYRRFVGLGWNDPVPDSTVLCRFRGRVGPARLRRVLDDLIAKARAVGLLGESTRVLDGTHIEAKIAKRSRRELVAQGRRHVLLALSEEDEALATSLAERYPPVRHKELTSSEARLEEERRRTRSFLEEVEARKPGAETTRRAALLRRVALEGNPEGIQSFDDQDARFGHKTEEWTFTGFKAHESLDPKSRLVTAVDVIPGNVQEPTRVGELLDREPGGLKRGAAVVMDGAYTGEPCHREVRERGGDPISPRAKLIRQIDRFQYDAAKDALVCPAGKASIARTRQDNGTLYQFSMKDCARCPLRDGCLRPSEKNGSANARARVWVGDTLKPKLAAGEAGAQYRASRRAERYKIEGSFGEQKLRSGLGIARYWGRVKVEFQAVITAIVADALKIVKWLTKQPSNVDKAALLAPA
jgi:transposase